MYLNNIDFPNRIVDSLQNGDLVIFAGAGASMDPPTSLPDFKKLTLKIAEDTGYTLKKNDSYEVFLGMLKAKGVPVNEQAAMILSGTCIEHNKLHEAIIDLFPNMEGVKIVTTNYDQMFEHVLDSREADYSVYNAPALPLGCDIHGIIHIHGNVNNPEYMVVTDEDFGRVYLTDGYVSRFLVKLFESYTVLFVGYSYNDTILRYLTRAMSRNNADRRYILTCDRKSDWSALGINPIFFPKQGFVKMRGGLVKLGLVAKKGLLDWKKQLSEIDDAPPKDLTVDTEIDYCLENIERSHVLAKCIHGTAWIPFMDGKKVFDVCFSDTDKLSEQGVLWANWLCDNFVGKDDEAIIQLIYKHNNCISRGFVTLLTQKLIKNKSITDEILYKYVVLFDSELVDPWIISMLIKEANEREIPCLAFRLYKKLLVCKLTLQPKWLSRESYEYKHTFVGDYFLIQHSWNLIKEEVCDELAYEVMIFVQEKIKDIHDQYVVIGCATSEKEPWEMSMLVIEDRDEHALREDVFHVLAKMYSDAALYLKEQDANSLRVILSYGVKSESCLMRKIVLKTIRIAHVFESDEILDMVINNGFIESACIKEQVFLLIAKIYMDLTQKQKNTLLDVIEAIACGDDDRNDNYTVYNWYAWLQRIDNSNERVNSITDQMRQKYGFETREHPERDIDSLSVVWIHDKSPLTEQELKELDYNEAVVYLRDYKGDPFDGPTRCGLLKTLESCVISDHSWAVNLIVSLIEQKITNEDIWEYIFNGIEEAKLSLDESVELLMLFASHIVDVRYDQAVSNMLFNIVQRDDMRDSFTIYEENLFSVSEIIWKNRNQKMVEHNRCIDLALNTTVGMLIISWINMISYTKESTIPERYRNLFEDALKLPVAEKKVSVCVLAGYFNYLCYRDKDWCVDNLADLLSGSDRTYFSNAWEGFAFFSKRINRDTADIITPVFDKAIKHIDWIENDTKHGFIELFLTLLIHVVDKPTFRFIPAFYRSASESDVEQFIHSIKGRLNGMDEAEKVKWWNDWLRRFLENRKINKPVPLSERENNALLCLLPELDFVFEEAVQIICKGKLPTVTEGMMWHCIEEKKLAQKFPRGTAILITKVLNSSKTIGFERMYIQQIANNIKNLEYKEQRRLQEALLNLDVLD